MVRGIAEISDSEYGLLYDNGVNVREEYEISIVTPNYNRGKLLENMLGTLARQDFDLRKVEMVIVDDGGEAKEVEILERMGLPFRIRYFRQEHCGRRVGRVRNIGVKNAKGKVVVFLDSDALCSPSLLREHYEKHRRTEGLVLLGDTFDLKRGEEPVFVQFAGLDSMYRNRFKFFRHYFKREVLLPLVYKLRGYPRGLCFCTLHASAKRNHLLAVNGFDEDLDGRWGDEDLELGYRLEKLGLIVRWSGSSFVYHQWHPIQFNVHNVDNRLRIFLRHPEILRARKIGGLDNPFRACSLEEICELDRKEAEALAARAVPAAAKRGREILYDNGVNAGIPPELSLVVSTYNRKDFLAGFLASVKSQTLDPRKFEVIVADDGGNDGSCDWVKSRAWPFRLIYVWQEDRGFRAASNRNNGVGAALGEIVVLADGDAVLPAHFLEAHYRSHQGTDRLALIGLAYYMGKRERLGGSLRRLRVKIRVERIRQEYLRGLSEEGRFSLGTCLSSVHCSFKRKDFLKVGGFDEDFDGIWGDEDIELGHRLAKAGVQFEFMNETIAYHRWHERVASRKWSDENRLMFLIKHQELLKHRLINIWSNHYFQKTLSDLRCFYLWSKRMRLLNRLKLRNVAWMEAKERVYACYRVLLPAFLMHVRNLWKKGVSHGEAAHCGDARVERGAHPQVAP
jgi:glycosyltransferase involved in cell wall biosynthesis